ncbi:hypothetical protein BGZ73_002379, partial [Actinomortierella ambigua]
MTNTPIAQQKGNPLEIPEIVHRLGQFIGYRRWGGRDYRDLFRSLLVCKTWYHALLPSLYEAQSDTGMKFCHGPKYMGTSVKNHQYFVRMLNLHLGPTDWYFPNLQFLSIRYFGIKTLGIFTTVLEKHASHLRAITLASRPLDSTHEIATVLGQMPKLTEL